MPHRYQKLICRMGSHGVSCHPIWQRWESRLYPQLKQVLDLATPEGYKAELRFVTWKRTAWNWTRDLSAASPTPYRSTTTQHVCGQPVTLKPGPHQQQCRSNIVECYNVECCFDNVAVFLATMSKRPLQNNFLTIYLRKMFVTVTK